MSDTQIFQVKEFLEEFHAAQKELQTKAQAKLHEVFRQFWDLNPAIKVVTWTQYAPYFNDGDVCVFSVHEPEFSNFDPKNREESAIRQRRRQALLERLTSEEKELLGIPLAVTEEEPSKEEWTWESYAFRKGASYGPKDLTGVNPESVWALAVLLESSAMREALEMTFGDDCRVNATRSGFEVTECEHD